MLSFCEPNFGEDHESCLFIPDLLQQHRNVNFLKYGQGHARQQSSRYALVNESFI